MKPIYFTKHARQRLKDRHTNEEEVRQTLRYGKWYRDEEGYLHAKRSFRFSREHFGRYYCQKKVELIFVEEKDRLVIITIYTYFSKREVL